MNSKDVESQNMDTEDQQGQQAAVAMGKDKVLAVGEDAGEDVGEQLAVGKEATMGKDVGQIINMINQMDSVNVSRVNLSSAREGTNQHKDGMVSKQSTLPHSECTWRTGRDGSDGRTLECTRCIVDIVIFWIVVLYYFDRSGVTRHARALRWC